MVEIVGDPGGERLLLHLSDASRERKVLVGELNELRFEGVLAGAVSLREVLASAETAHAEFFCVALQVELVVEVVHIVAKGVFGIKIIISALRAFYMHA